jgi:hypothetical protein
MEIQFRKNFSPILRINSPFLYHTPFFGISYKNQVISCNVFTNNTKMKHFRKTVAFSEKCGIMHMKSTAATPKRG